MTPSEASAAPSGRPRPRLRSATGAAPETRRYVTGTAPGDRRNTTGAAPEARP